MFNPFNAYTHAQSLAFPRACGTAGEKQAETYCFENLKKSNIDCQRLPFTYSTITDLLSRFIPFVCSIIVWIIAFSSPGFSWGSIAMLSALLVIGSFALLLPLPAQKLHSFHATRQSTNLLGTIPARSGTSRHHLVFMAHYDSKSQILPIALRALCYIFLPVSVIVLLITLAIDGIWSSFPYRFISYICGYGALICGTLLACNRTGNRSPGASDNAAGSAILLELAAVFAQKPLHTITLSFLFTGAEEYGMAGATRFIESQK
ncbi:MAG: M28 family peptidase [Chitinivibrionales bacterium]|nr:M28 family peptidase [Chitinivibrionales bacterium]